MQIVENFDRLSDFVWEMRSGSPYSLTVLRAGICAGSKVEPAFKASTGRIGSLNKQALITAVREVHMRLTD